MHRACFNYLGIMSAKMFSQHDILYQTAAYISLMDTLYPYYNANDYLKDE